MTDLLDINDFVPRFKYQSFAGPITEKMPKLIEDRRVPISIAQILERRLISKKPYWENNDVTSGDAIAYHFGGRVKIVLDSQHLREISPQSKWNTTYHEHLTLEEGAYDLIQGEEFSNSQFAELSSQYMSDSISSNPIWKIVARDQNLLKEYLTFLGKSYHGYEGSRCISLPMPRQMDHISCLMPLSIRPLSSKYVGGGSSLNCDSRSLIGVDEELILGDKK